MAELLIDKVTKGIPLFRSRSRTIDTGNFTAVYLYGAIGVLDLV
jgi:hypothetical protein